MGPSSDHAAMADEPDYASYSLENLYYARRNIDRDHYGARLTRIELEIAKREAALRETTSESRDGVGGAAEKPDTRSRRVGAMLIDIFVLLPVFAVLSIVGAKAGGPVLVACAGAWILILALYSAIGHARWGGTVGKCFTGLRVTSLQGNPAGFGTCLLREIFVVLLTVGWLAWWAPRILGGVEESKSMATVIPMIALMWVLWWVLELVTMGLNERRQSVQDRMARTLVLRSDKRPSADMGSPLPIVF